MANFVFIHGSGGNPDECFYLWLRKELQKRGHKVHAPFFPTPLGQTLDNWMKEFEPYWQYVNEETIFVGRSIGPAFILRLLEKPKVSVKAAFLVAGFCSDLGVHEFRPLIKTFVGKRFKWEKIRNSCDRFFVYNSDNDLIVPIQKGEELAKKLETKFTVVNGARHFLFKKFPQLLEDIRKIVQ